MYVPFIYTCCNRNCYFLSWFFYTECGGDLVSATGSFSSPSYPNQYMHSRVCEWRITVQIGHQVNLYFDDFDVEDSSTCVFDSVKVLFHSQWCTNNLNWYRSHEMCIHYGCKGLTDLSLILYCIGLRLVRTQCVDILYSIRSLLHAILQPDWMSLIFPSYWVHIGAFGWRETVISW